MFCSLLSIQALEIASFLTMLWCNSNSPGSSSYAREVFKQQSSYEAYSTAVEVTSTLMLLPDYITLI